jgi:hypothetical protein
MLLRVLRQVHPYVLLQLNREAAINEQSMAGDERGLARAQEDDSVGDVVWCPGSPQWVHAGAWAVAVAICHGRPTAIKATMRPGVPRRLDVCMCIWLPRLHGSGPDCVPWRVSVRSYFPLTAIGALTSSAAEQLAQQRFTISRASEGTRAGRHGPER